MSALDDGIRRLAEVLSAYVAGEMDEAAAGNTAVMELADLEDSLPGSSHDASKEGLFLRAFWAAEELREPPEHRTRISEIRYLLACLKGEDEYDKQRADSFYEA